MMNPHLLAENLSSPYKDVFERATIYASLRNIAEQDAEDALLNLYDSLYTAQTDGRPVNSIIKTDVEDFLQTYFDGLEAVRFLDKLPKHTFSLTKLWFITEVVIMVLDVLSGQQPQAANLSYLISGLAITGIISLIGRPLYNFLVKSNCLKPNTFYPILLSLLVALFLTSIELSKRFPLKLPAPWGLIWAALLFAPIALYRLYRNYSTYGTWRDLEEWQSKKQQKAQKKEEFEQLAEKALYKKAQKDYQNLLVKGQDGEALLQKYTKDLRFHRVTDKCLFWFCVLVYLLALWPVVGKDSLTDTLIYASFQGIVLTTIFLFFRKNNQDILARKTRLLQELTDHKDQLDTFLNLKLTRH